VSFRNKVIVGLVGLALADLVLPFPILAAFMIYVVAARPPYFRDWVSRVYGGF